MAYTYNGNYSHMRKRDILLYTRTWTELEGVILSEISQTVKTNAI